MADLRRAIQVPPTQSPPGRVVLTQAPTNVTLKTTSSPGQDLPVGPSRPLSRVQRLFGKDGDQCNPWSDPYGCPLIAYIITIVVGLLINLIIVGFLPNRNRVGAVITNNQKWMAATLGIGLTVTITIIFGAWLYYLCTGCRYVSGRAVFSIAIVFALLLTFFIGLIMGEYLLVGHLWFRDRQQS